MIKNICSPIDKARHHTGLEGGQQRQSSCPTEYWPLLLQDKEQKSISAEWLFHPKSQYKLCWRKGLVLSRKLEQKSKEHSLFATEFLTQRWTNTSWKSLFFSTANHWLWKAMSTKLNSYFLGKRVELMAWNLVTSQWDFQKGNEESWGTKGTNILREINRKQ